MNTVVYLIRHSVRMKRDMIEEYNTSQSELQRNEKIILNVEGERRAEILSNKEELQNFDVVYASNCVRTLQTAKYFLEKQGLKVNIDERFDERRIGYRNSDVYPDWFSRQYKDENYTTFGGESQLQVRERFNEAFNEALEKYKGKRIAIFTHGLAMTFFLLNWCKLMDVNDEHKITLSFNDKVIFDSVVNAPEVFKIVFDEENKPISIENIVFEDLPFNEGV